MVCCFQWLEHPQTWLLDISSCKSCPPRSRSYVMPIWGTSLYIRTHPERSHEILLGQTRAGVLFPPVGSAGRAGTCPITMIPVKRLRQACKRWIKSQGQKQLLLGSLLCLKWILTLSYSGAGVKLAMLDIAVLPNTFFPGVSCTSPEGFSALAFYVALQ